MTVVRHRFSVDDYHRMAQAGILDEDDRVELIDGEIVQMAPIGRRHAAQVARLEDMLHGSVRGRAIVWTQNPLRLGERSEVQPDLALLVPRADYYASRVPGPEDVLLVVEVADSSAEYDRQVKAPLYARHGIGELWLIDLERGQVEVCRRPGPEGYAEVVVAGPGDVLSPLALPDVSLPVAEMLVP
jgi:Uma2 family endonuclease